MAGRATVPGVVLAPGVVVMRCLWRYCTATYQPVEQLARPGSDEIERVVPIHDVEGPGDWFGRCPASSILLQPYGKMISVYARKVLEDGAATFERMAEERARWVDPPNGGELTAGHAPGGMWDRITSLLGGVTGASQDNSHPLPDDNYFPGRPADVPEDGTIPVPAHVAGTSHGRQSMDNMRDQLKALTLLAVNAFGEAQETCAQMTESAQRVQALCVALKAHVQSGRALAAAAVGNAGDLPESADKMLDHADIALSTIEDILPMASLLVMRIEAVSQSLAAAAANGREYYKLP